jgi:hypothetical protein
MRLRSKKLRGETLNQIIAAIRKESLIAAMIDAKSSAKVLKNLGLQDHTQNRRALQRLADVHGLQLPRQHNRNDIKCKKDLTGMVFGYLSVTAESPTIDGVRQWLCVEQGTNKTGTVSAKDLLYGRRKSFSFQVKSGCMHKQWGGFGEISGNFWNEIKGKAMKRALEFSITIQQAWEVFLQQDGKCALTGLVIHMPKTNKAKRTASLDRIDSTKGYTSGNIQWLHKDINIMKNVHSQDYFIQLCKAVANKSADLK